MSDAQAGPHDDDGRRDGRRPPARPAGYSLGLALHPSQRGRGRPSPGDADRQRRRQERLGSARRAEGQRAAGQLRRPAPRRHARDRRWRDIPHVRPCRDLGGEGGSRRANRRGRHRAHGHGNLGGAGDGGHRAKRCVAQDRFVHLPWRGRRRGVIPCGRRLGAPPVAQNIRAAHLPRRRRGADRRRPGEPAHEEIRNRGDRPRLRGARENRGPHGRAHRRREAVRRGRLAPAAHAAHRLVDAA